MKTLLTFTAILFATSALAADNAPVSRGTAVNPPTASGANFQLLGNFKPITEANGVMKQTYPDQFQKPGGSKK